jgi:transposase
MLDIFSMLSGFDILYKTIERLYSNNEVVMAIFNLPVLILNNIANSDATGDGTGYSLTVKKNYESYAQRFKDLAKEFVNDTMNYLEKYHERGNSELVFATDKKILEWNMPKRRDGRISNVLLSISVWYDLFNIGRL